jgi:hypothetical protein
MNYNILIETKNNTRSLLDRDENTIKKIISAFKENKEFIFIDAEKFYTGELREIQVYEFNNNHFQTGKELYQYCEKEYKLIKGYFSDPYVPKSILDQVGKKVTPNFINDNELELLESLVKTDSYVNIKRIKELEKITNINYDLTRLLAILKEVNVCNKNKLKFAIPPLIRSIIDQVPPIFGKANFSEVCGSYGSKSFKDSMVILDKNSRKIADSYLHTQIRKNESALPTETQINFKSELDVLLQEIVRIS